MTSKINFLSRKTLVSRYIHKLQSILLTVIFILCMSFLASNNTATADTFGCFVGTGNTPAICNSKPALTTSTNGQKCTNGLPGVGDWNTTSTNTNSDVTVISIHGGSIEVRTSDISEDLHNFYNWNHYDFNGHVTNSDCAQLAKLYNPNCTVGDTYCTLHITAENFNDPTALQLVTTHPRAVSIHGCGSSCSTNTICIGGRNLATRNLVRDYINQYKGLVSNSPLTFVDTNNRDTDASCNSGIMGTSLDNIVNRTSTNEGLQLEISRNIRDALANNSIQNDLLRTIVYGGTAEGVGELPLPILATNGTENYTTSAGTFKRYQLKVENKIEYPADLFAAAPNLPPCGLNTNSSRTWVNIYNASNDQYIYGFCALGTPENLDSIWFAVQDSNIPPSAVYITLEDRQNNRIYRSNRVTITP